MRPVPSRNDRGRRARWQKEGDDRFMERFLASGLALAFALLAVAAFARTPAAQTGPEVLEACEPGRQEIDARDLPRSVDPARCPVEGRVVEDGPVGSVVPPPGKGVYAEVLTTGGAEELGVRRLENGTIELEHVGGESGGARDAGAGSFALATKSLGECGDPAFDGSGWRVEDTHVYRINWRTTPRDVSRRAAISAIRQAGGNVADTVNGCGLGDRVPAGVAYKGYTARQAGVGGGACATDDGLSVVSFGSLSNPGNLAATCVHTRTGASGYDVVTSSDAKINKTDYHWTTEPNDRRCSRRWDIEGVMTHERGHTFGLGHVAEADHPSLTMGPTINGACQASERSLGRGDVLGLDKKYP
ncbi:MAG: hypothetical protein AVDCRST_MAG02-1040 [uncultured Rubrobacteraceae bacterium]|uniref:Peptidase M10 metallopeptidase domain-containing protein n=1 Tax=uncultured Rubrobacteraceae bacterium TaxID=349277 RepID=A0A6J4QPI0_9ACTN|nr:MAG: hypothetical protein AVDCRST_MAG02-1040 [uncultured Rubrobacteraceae bacterium]